MYSFFHNITYKNTFWYSISLHSFYICELIFEKLVNILEYKSLYNIIFLKNTVHLLFMYLFLMKVMFLNIYFFKKYMMLLMFGTFYFCIKLNEIYKKRIYSIENKKDFIDPFKILIITPNIDIMNKIIKYTNVFHFSNYLIFINIILYLFIL